MKKRVGLIIIIFLSTIANSFSQRHISTNEDGSAYIPLKLYRSFFNKDISKKDLKKIKINGKDTLVLIENFEKFKSKMSKSTSFKSESRSYMDLKSYKKRYKKPLTQKDSLNFKFRENDTLVLVEGYKPKGVYVPYEEVDSTFLEIYKDIVYKKRNGKQAERYKKLTMRLWKDDINIYFAKTIDKKLKKELTKFAIMLSDNVDSLEINVVKQIEKSNYIIYGIDSTNTYKYHPNTNKDNGGYYIYWNGKQQIYNCKLELKLDAHENKENLQLHAKQFFLGSLGNFHSTYSLPKQNFLSLWPSKNKIFGNEDLKILKYHYSYGICKGTNLEKFEDQHQRAKETVKKGHKTGFIHKE